MAAYTPITSFMEREGELIQQIALLLWLKQGQQYEALYDVVTGVKTWFEMVKLFEQNEGFQALKIGLLAWLHTGFGAQGIIQESVTSTSLVQEVQHFMNQEDDLEGLRLQTIYSIANFVQSNPAASEDTIRDEVLKHINVFASQVDSM